MGLKSHHSWLNSWIIAKHKELNLFPSFHRSMSKRTWSQWQPSSKRQTPLSSWWNTWPCITATGAKEFIMVESMTTWVLWGRTWRLINFFADSALSKLWDTDRSTVSFMEMNSLISSANIAVRLHYMCARTELLSTVSPASMITWTSNW